VLPIDVASNEEIKQAILDEPRRRNDHTYKRIREEDLQPAEQQRTAVEEEEVDESTIQKMRMMRKREANRLWVWREVAR
jgi:hypothetical protein